jgi:hypothetical protein
MDRDLLRLLIAVDIDPAVTWATPAPDGTRYARTPTHHLTVAPAPEDRWLWRITNTATGVAVEATAPHESSAISEILLAYAELVPASYHLRSWIPDTFWADDVAEANRRQPFPGGPRLDSVTLDYAVEAAVAYTTEYARHWCGVVCEVFDVDGRPLTTVQDGVPASL